jgi:hypothetical protein
MKMHYVLLAALTLSAVAAHADHEDSNDNVVQIGQWTCEGRLGINNPPCAEVRFDQPFAAPPKIAISFNELHYPLQGPGLPSGGDVSVKASNVTKDGFSPVVSAYNVGGPYVGNWVAVGREGR